MYLITKIHVLQNFSTTSYMTQEHFSLRNRENYKLLGLKLEERKEEPEELEKIMYKKRGLKLTVNALFLQPFVKECIKSKVYRINILSHLNELTSNPENGVILLKLILVPPDKEIVDYLWNERMLKLIWSRVEIENAFSWLSTLGGAYSALGDYFEHCADEAGRISVRQYKLSKMLGDDSLAARSRLYSALSHAQKGRLKLSRHIVRQTAEFARSTHDKRLLRMCQGVWAKLKYLRSLNKSTQKLRKLDTKGNGDI